MTNHETTLEVVLEAFATELATNPNALKKYLSAYPQFSIELVDLSMELRQLAEAAEDTSRDDEAFMSDTLMKFQIPQVRVHRNQRIPGESFRNAAKKFKIPFSIMLAIKEKRVEPSTISNRLLDLIARAIEISTEDFQSYISGPINLSVKANKSDEKPTAAAKVPFEKILRDANTSSDDLAELIERGL